DNGRQLIEQLHGALTVRLIGRADRNGQGHASRIRDYVPFTTVFRAIRGLGACVAPPQTARSGALSISVRERLSEPRFPRRRNNRRWTSGQMLACVQSRSRRQHVTPLPQPISKGSMFQVRPLLRTKMIPAKQARSDTGGRPPLTDAVRFGKSGST